MVNLRDKKKIIIALGLIILSISMVVVPIFFRKNLDIEMLEKNLELINKECNSVYKDMDNNEKKYKTLLENEKDSFKRGLYASALIQFYAIKGEPENIVKYIKVAEENYKIVDGGEYYIIADKKYIAWVMLRSGNYPESFRVASELLELVNTSEEELLTQEQVLDTEALIYSIFLYIYSHFEILDKAQIYYEKLNNIEMTQELELAKGDRIASSKMMYAEKKEDFDLVKKYAQECYDIILKKDKINGTDTAASVLSNIAYANIKLGEFDEGLKQLEKSEEYHKKIQDNYGLVVTYENYASYYEEIGNAKLAIDYYKKTLKLHSEAENYYGLEDTLNALIKCVEENGLNNEGMHLYYEAFYELTKKIDEESPVNDFLSQVISINDELNESSILLLEAKSKQTKRGAMIAIIVIIILGTLITRMDKLIKIKRESEKKLEAIANTDYLTGLNTRSYGEKLIVHEMKKGTKLSIAVIDIDHFKNINDTYGHIFGDFILKEVAKYIKDSLGENAIITRFGGEEFTIAFVDKGREEARVMLDQIREDISGMVFDNNASVSFSAGIAEWDKIRGKTSIEFMIKEADILLYKAKREGRNKVLV
ncbi:tetratricopeptide repeat-containing diguanylate cyclase [uncultured Clostridium sp.]|uniref:tetratricopeptide repeat-containing diguanylate cyclase n=1 Tax=uncultured Clostridium sp. TaxID=59620 RepID=UPI002622E661|nr:tetratricopeptide repeat-containing diguanylate cyclase [uncultured Clostridium sp.]